MERKFSEVADIIRSAFPQAKSRRTVKIQFRDKYQVSDYWDGGSRDECRFLDLTNGNILSSSDIPDSHRQVRSNPFNLPIAEVLIGENYAVIEHSIFRGKDMGYRILLSKKRQELPQDNLLKAMDQHPALNA